MGLKKKIRGRLRYSIPVIQPPRLSEKVVYDIKKVSPKEVVEIQPESPVEEPDEEVSEVMNPEEFFFLPPNVQIEKMLQMDWDSIQNLCEAASFPEEYRMQVLIENPERVLVFDGICNDTIFWKRKLERSGIDPGTLEKVNIKAVIEEKTEDAEFWKQEYGKLVGAIPTLESTVTKEEDEDTEDTEEDSEDEDVIVFI